MQNGACIFIKLKYTLAFIILDFLSQTYSNIRSKNIQSKNHLARIKVFEMIFYNYLFSTIIILVNTIAPVGGDWH